MRKYVTAGLTTVALMAVGIGAAQAASSGSYSNLSAPGAVVTSGRYNFYADPHDCVQGSCLYYTRVSGHLSVTDGDAHLQAKSDGYGYVSIFNNDGKAELDFSKRLSPGDVRYANSFTLQLCHENWYWDDCSSRKVTR